MGKITLIGTNHADPQGPISLERALGMESPEIVTVESGPRLAQAVLSGYLKKSMIKQLKKARKIGLRDDVYQKIAAFTKRNHSYEVVQSAKYARENDIPIHYIDHPDTDIGPIEAAGKSIQRGSIGNINAFSIENFYSESKKWYDFSKRAFDDLDFAQQVINRYSTLLMPHLDRDEVPASNLRQLTEEFPDAKIVHIAGCIHLLDDQKERTLYSKIKNLSPERKLLCDY